VYVTDKVHANAVVALMKEVLGNLLVRRRSSRPRRYATPAPYRRPSLSALPSLVRPVHGPEDRSVDAVRPYVLDDLHRARRRRARNAAIDRSRLGLAVLIDIGSSQRREEERTPHPIPRPRPGGLGAPVPLLEVA
jgi:hypothetical protein